MKTVKPRKVFGRRKIKVDGKDFAIEMRKDCVTVRQKWGACRSQAVAVAACGHGLWSVGVEAVTTVALISSVVLFAAAMALCVWIIW